MSKLSHIDYMKSALQLAERGRASVSPNPMVGCVIVNQGELVGQGFHLKPGKAHAEVAALEMAGEKAKGGTAYVTLEPCCHFGRTPPCCNALIQAGIAKVYVACLDPNPLVAGKGIEKLKAAGIEVEVGLLENQAIALNEIFFHYIRLRKPFVIAKWAMSLDGKTVTHKNDSPDISCKASRKFSHQIRQQVDAILIGANTAILDNPELTVRYLENNSKQPLRIILSGKNKLPLDLKLFDTSIAKTLVVITENAESEYLKQLAARNVEVLVLADTNARADLDSLLSNLGERGISSLLVEGGMTVIHEFFNQSLVNKIHVYLAPTIIGTLDEKQPVINMNVSSIHSDLYITGDFHV